MAPSTVTLVRDKHLRASPATVEDNSATIAITGNTMTTTTTAITASAATDVTSATSDLMKCIRTTSLMTEPSQNPMAQPEAKSDQLDTRKKRTIKTVAVPPHTDALDEETHQEAMAPPTMTVDRETTSVTPGVDQQDEELSKSFFRQNFHITVNPSLHFFKFSSHILLLTICLKS
jgi:hypothetical protein